MGSDLTESALQQAVRSVSAIHDICKQYDRESSVPVTSSSYSTPSTALLLEVLLSHKNEGALCRSIEI